VAHHLLSFPSDFDHALLSGEREMNYTDQMVATGKREEAPEQTLSDWFVVVVPDTEAAMSVIEHLELIQAREKKVEEIDGRYRIRWR
jgi:hypothetical protein